MKFFIWYMLPLLALANACGAAYWIWRDERSMIERAVQAVYFGGLLFAAGLTYLLKLFEWYYAS